MAVVTAHNQTSYAARAATDPVARVVARAAGKGPLNMAVTVGLPVWFNEGTAAARTINPYTTGVPEKRRTGR